MPEVIVNTSPLQYLFQTGALEFLPFQVKSRLLNDDTHFRDSGFVG
jgi:hypothetical protein